MVPTPQEQGLRKEYAHAPGERVVISGMAGLYPQANHVKDLEDILYKKKNPITDTDCRWNFTHPEVRHHTGKIPGPELLDAQFFKVHYRLANCMDAMGRRVLEQSYQAIYDAGLNPEHLSGKKVGVYVGSCYSETEKVSFFNLNSRTGFGIAGCSKTMFANRISYWLNAKGPSMSIDGACCSSLVALEQAYLAITRGECEAAIVGGAHLTLHPHSTVHYGRAVTLCPDGRAKVFDENADGCAKSEAVNVLFLQKAKDAKRIYAEVLHVKSQFIGVLEGETGPKYGFYRDPLILENFYKTFYDEINFPPEAVEYIEAFGSAVPDADKVELEAIERVFCQGRQTPLLVGSVMSNIGYTEAASGIAGITKVLLGYHKSELAGNLHCENPRRDVAALRDGCMKILTDHHPFRGAYTAVNSNSFTGYNAHVLLNGRYKAKNPTRYQCSFPRLVTISGRQDSAVQKILDGLKSRPIDPEELALLHNIHQDDIRGHVGRGYTILTTNEEGQTISLSETSNYYGGGTRPLWFVYSGMGSQWAGMGAQLMRIPIFAAAIERCQKALEPKGLDVVQIITNPDKNIFDNILNSFVGIAAIQIGLTDILTAVGIVPDKIIGHSVGELGCAYADGCFTAEEMILSAYSRGLVSVQTPFIKGSMAAVGIGYEQISALVPPEIEVACHNGPGSSTISGPADIMKEFVANLTGQGIFAREVSSSNIAYHSRYIAEAGPGLLKYLSEVIKDPKPRSDRWMSTSVPQDKWDQPEAKFSSAVYHTNNLLSPVLFEETSRLVPPNAILVEIAPHALLQAILKRSLPASCTNIPLTRRGHSDNVFMVLDAIGKLYVEGFHPKVQALYPQIEFPVSTGTPMLNHLVEWVHQEKWNVPYFHTALGRHAAAWKFTVSVHDEEYSYLQGHILRGKNMYPFAAALVAVWDTLAMSLNVPRKQLAVEFHDLRLFAQPTMFASRSLRISIELHRGNGRFEILNSDQHKIATGFISKELIETSHTFDVPFESNERPDIDADDVYQMFYEKDYFYGNEFRSIHKVNKPFTEAQIVWEDNWVTFIDGVLQLAALRQKHNTVVQPYRIRKLVINPNKNDLIEVDGKNIAAANVFALQDFVRCGGVLIHNIQFRKLPLLEEDAVTLKTLNFVPRFQAKMNIQDALQVYLQIVAENLNKNTLSIIKIVSSDKKHDSNELRNIFDDAPGIFIQLEQIRIDEVHLMRDTFLTKADVVLVDNLTSNDNLCKTLYRVLDGDTFLINVERQGENNVHPAALYRVLSAQSDGNTKLELIKWRPTQDTGRTSIVTVKNPTQVTLMSATRSKLVDHDKLVVLTTYPPLKGLKEVVKRWRKESNRNQIYMVMASDKIKIEDLPKLDLVYNVFNGNQWGGEYYTSYQESISRKREVTLRSSRFGDLDSLHWVETPKPIGLGIPVHVHFAAINNLDVKKAKGIIPLREEKEITYCMDFSGVTDKGERVMGLVLNGGATTRVRARPELLWPVPKTWTLEDAATVPSAYAHAFYCLYQKVDLMSNHKVLVHGATGALGQAAISIALAHGCEVFATVSDVRKKRFLMELFPEIKENHIGNSRDASFGDMVKAITKTEGCDIVLSCVEGYLKDVSVNCVASSGLIIDVNQIAHQESYTFGLYHLNNTRNYTPVDFLSMFTANNFDEIKRIQLLVSEGIAHGYVRPLTRVTYPAQQVSRAFRLLAGSRHRGRILLRLQGDTIAAEPTLECSPDACHVILCDDQPFSLQLAERLVSRGVRKLHLHCTKPSNNLRVKVESWLNSGVKVQVSTENLNSNRSIITLLSESKRIGTVEGIYIIATDGVEQAISQLEPIVANMDAVARKLCPSMRYFVVVNTELSIGKSILLSRVRDGLPALMLKLSGFKQNTTAKEDHEINKPTMSWRCAVSATERALCSSQRILLAHPLKVQRPSLLQQIASVADLSISENGTIESSTLLDLGIDSTKVTAVCSFLQDAYNIALFEENIPGLTVHIIRELEKSVSELKFEKVSGLGNFFQYVDSDELMATTDIMVLPTITNSAKTISDWFDNTQTYLYILPGMEGHHNRFRTLCERLKLPAMVLQPGLDHLYETPRDTAERYAKTLLKKVSLGDNFYLLGYESGVIVALEVAAILEDHGLTGTVFCLGGTPEEFRQAVEDELSDVSSDADLQDAVARHMFTLMTGNLEGLEKALNDASNWQEKTTTCVRMLLGRVAHSAHYARNLMEAAYTKLKLAREYKIEPRELKSKLVLLHAASLKADVSPVALLQKHSQQPVIVHELQETLAHAAQDLRCPAIINSHLDPQILKAHEEKNLCETYLMSVEKFIYL